MIKVKCMLCPSLDGLVKKVRGNVWVHLSCVNWLTNVEFKDELKEVIEGVIPKKMFNM